MFKYIDDPLQRYFFKLKWGELNLLFHSPSPFSCNKKRLIGRLSKQVHIFRNSMTVNIQKKGGKAN